MGRPVCSSASCASAHRHHRSWGARRGGAGAVTRHRATGSSTSAAASGTRPSRSPGWSGRPGGGRRRRRRRGSSRRAPRRRARRGVDNARFAVADVQTATFGGAAFDMAFSRMGTMFFASTRWRAAQRAPRAEAGRKARDGRVAPAGPTTTWLYRAQGIVEGIVEAPRGVRRADVRTRAVLDGRRRHDSDILLHAGFGDISLHRCDLPILVGRDVDEAIDVVMCLGPAGEILRLPATAPPACTARSARRCATGGRVQARPDGRLGPGLDVDRLRRRDGPALTRHHSLHDFPVQG